MPQTLEDVAARLRGAYRGGAIAPLRDRLEPTDAEGAYAVQRINTDVRRAAGLRIVGRKVGLTAKAVQAQLGVDQPDYGGLFDDMAVPDGGRAARLARAAAQGRGGGGPGHGPRPRRSRRHARRGDGRRRLCRRRHRDRRQPHRRLEDHLRRHRGRQRLLGLLRAGRERKPLAGLDLYTCGMAMEVNGALASLGARAACLGHPLNAAAWLARTLAAMGEGLKAGDVLLTGALGPMAAISPGDRVEARIGGLGRVGFTYREDRA